MEKILITGSTGHLGIATVERLTKGNCKSIILSRKNSPQVTFLKKKYGCASAILDFSKKENKEELRKICSEVTSVIHLAGFVPKKAEEDNLHEAITGNLLTTVNLIEALPKGVPFIFASTCEVYGEPQCAPITEAHPTQPLSYYGMSKVAAEHALQLYCKKNEITLTILRFTNIYGPGETIQRAIPNFIKAALHGENINIYGDGSDLRDFLYITDAAEAILTALQKGKDKTGSKTYTIASGKSISIKEVAEKILQIFSSSLGIEFQEHKKPAMNYVFDISQAQKDLNYAPRVALEEGLRREIEWCRENEKYGEQQPAERK